MKKLLVVGLDGATFDVMDRYVQEHPDGALARLYRSGTVRTLKSTLPFFTGPAWTTCMTGLRPDQHGVFHWRGRFDADRGNRPLVSTRHLEEAFLWWYVQQQGGRVSVTNFPMAYPAPPTEGVFVCGTLSLEDAPGQTWPPHLAEDLKERLPGYRYEIEKGLSFVDRPAELRKHILEVGTNHLAAAVDFAQPSGADLAVHVVTVTDRMQHFFWDHEDGAGSAVRDAYAFADDALAKLLAQQDWDNVVVVSDHGAGPSRQVFQTDDWLVEHGWAQRSGNGCEVDMHRSWAYAGEEPEIAIYVNRQDRQGYGVPTEEYAGFLKQLQDGLLALRVPDTGQPVFQQVLVAEDVYDGPLRDLGPDLILIPTDGIHPRPGLAGTLFTQPGGLISGHRIDGIFLAGGADFPLSPDRAANRSLEMAEVFSVLCAAQGVAIPDGIPVSPLLAELGVQYTVDEGLHWIDQVDGEPAQQADSPDMLRRLAELGYL
ncbi:alkaline phosphatase family protein [Streptomyces sp. NBC_00876]|uniref:alkaline phosphatase family protein n=1 Tax=Streptomyces sp. NBC_00876 TaxID=2975853 RepID=UPI003864D8C3|nr:alkaline phosphatase family protein [Streptomyces sp. NBC_00876]